VTTTLVIAVLILLNGLFVAAEFAIIGAPRQVIERLARRGNLVARVVSKVLSSAREQDRYIATAQLGITTASLGLGMYGEHVLAEWLALRLEALGELRYVGAHGVASAIAISILTYFHIVVGEIVPKSLALRFPVPVVLWVAAPMRIIELALFPLVVVLNGLGNLLLGFMGIRRTTGGEERYRSADELALIVAESGEEGVLAHEPSEVIQELLEFGELTAGEVMVPRTWMVSLPLGATRAQVAAVLEAEPHTRYPVVDGGPDHVIGVVHVKDLLALPTTGGVTRELVREVPFLPRSHPLEGVLAEMRRARSHFAVVMNEHGGTAGIITLEDVFEEVVGEIGDSATPAPAEPDSAGVLRVAGTARLEELGEAMGMVLEHEEVDTVSGLVIAILGRPPHVGDRVEYAGIGLEVTAVRGRGVKEARVLGAPTAPGDEPPAPPFSSL
jgi:CBS domain containing-hemolysin-like protein